MKYCTMRRMLLLIAGIVFFINPGNVLSDDTTLYERSLTKLQAKIRELHSKKEYTFVVLGDSRDNDEVFKKSLVLANGFNPLFILHTGDITNGGTEKETQHFLSVLKNTLPDIPFFVVVGNHEKKYSDKTFQEKIAPLDYLIDIPRLDTKIIVLDNSDYLLKPKQMDYLRRQLSEKRPFTFVSMHIPPKTSRWFWHTMSEGASGLVSMLSASKVSLAFFGHLHLYDEDEIGGIKYITTGGAGAPLNRFGFPGDPVYHIVVVKIVNGAVSHAMVKVPD